MYEIMSADEAIRLIRDGDCICVNSFVGIENPTELHEAIYRRYQKRHRGLSCGIKVVCRSS